MSEGIDIIKLEKELDGLLEEAAQQLSHAQDPGALEALRVQYLGRKGRVTAYFQQLGQPGLSPEDKARLGKKLNGVREKLEQALQERRQALAASPARPAHAEDITLPGHRPTVGRLHPVTQAIDEIVAIFRSIGFLMVEGPEVETEYRNFEALNIPEGHPSREGFDTFYLSSESVPPAALHKGDKPPLLLRTHTSPVQIRFMQSHQPPFQIIVPGRVFRRDAVDASHCFQFHQVEGLAVGPGLTFGDLKGTLTAWARGMFGSAARLRFRPHYFPFTEPSAEADLACVFCDGKGCRVCGQKGWLEILGCGMVHPAVFKAVGYPVGTVGFAFGLGVERVAMLRYGIEDIRFFYENDLRFLQQFP